MNNCKPTFAILWYTKKVLLKLLKAKNHLVNLFQVQISGPIQRDFG